MQISEQTKYILNSIYDGIIIVNTNYKIEFINKAYSRILGITKNKIEGYSLSTIEPNAKLLDAIKNEKEVINEKVHIESLNKDVVVHINLLYDNETLIGGLSVFKDITDYVQLSKELAKTRELNKYLKKKESKNLKLPSEFDAIIGQSSNLLNELNKAYKASQTKVPILVRGENGTGKGQLVEIIHNVSERKNNNFVPVNCAAIPENLLESELFGYKEGAFTGAVETGKIGKFEKADKGTIFLDEIGDMSLPMQAKILKVVEEQRFYKIGSNELVEIDVRIIAATNKNLEKMIHNNEFREDLYYRLNVVSIWLPPLRKRNDDIYLLIKHFIDEYNRKMNISEKAINILTNYKWPGNIRELESTIKYANIMAKDNKIDINHLPENITKNREKRKNLNNYNAKDLLEIYEKNLFIEALNKSNNNRSKAIKILGLSRRTFYKKLKKYDLY